MTQDTVRHTHKKWGCDLTLKSDSSCRSLGLQEKKKNPSQAAFNLFVFQLLWIYLKNNIVYTLWRVFTLKYDFLLS